MGLGVGLEIIVEGGCVDEGELVESRKSRQSEITPRSLLCHISKTLAYQNP